MTRLALLPGGGDASAVDRLSDYSIQEFAPAFGYRTNKYMPHSAANNPKQWAFLTLDCQEALYGGAAGGGKSDALLMAALQYVDVPDYSALLLRRTYADLEKPDALIPRAYKWLKPTDAHWDGQKRQWRFPSGAVLDFGYIDNDKDPYKFQSSAYQFIGFDELTQFEESWYRYMFSRKRRLISMVGVVPTRVRGATNPVGIGLEWVKQRFIIEGPAHGRVFIRALLNDNPHINRQEYEESLQELDPTTYAQLRHGDWNVRAPGVFFDGQKFKILDEAPPGLRWIRSWDLAATKNKTSAWTAGVKMALYKGQYYIGDVRRKRGDPGEVEELVKQTAEIDGKNVPVHIEQEPGSGGVGTLWRFQREVLVGYSVHAYHPRGDKVTRAKPFSSAAKLGNVLLVRGNGGGWITAYCDEASAFPNGFKDQIDSSSQAVDVLTTSPTPNVRRL